ncbi:hypothetical protein FJZ19_00790 [Candidatus Pacearchaeota archaeon]|nr:hypothetical protein [Candidatus Pacearchaeota archaeon]
MTTLAGFIKQARNRGYDDISIKNALISKGWNSASVEKAFLNLNPKYTNKNQVCVFLSNEVLSTLDKRSKRNMLTLSEQIEDILRRSCTRKKLAQEQEKLDDFLVSCFSRVKRK